MPASSDPASGPAPDELFEHAEFLRALARALLRDEQRAEDVLQDTFVAALERPPGRLVSPRAFLASVVRHLASNAARGERRRAERERRVARPEAQRSHSEVGERLEMQRAVLELVLALGEPYRTTLYRRYYDGLGPAAIARREGVPLKTVKTRLARGLTQLRAQLDERSGGERGAWCAALLAVARPREGALLALPAATLGGALMAKKLAVAALALVLAWFGWRAASTRALGSGTAGPVELTRVVDPVPEIVAEPRPAPSEERDVRSALVGEDPALTGALVVLLRWETDARPAGFVELRARSEGDPAPRDSSVAGRTDANGRARFYALHAGTVRLELDRGPRFEVELARGEEREVELVIPAGIDVEGRVVDPSGRGVAGAEIWLGSPHGIWPVGSLATTSAADGRFTVRALLGESLLGARAAGYQPSLLVQPKDVAADERGVRAVELVLGAPGGGVHGVVLEPDGVPVAGALVHAGPRGGHTTGASREIAPRPVPVATDADGRFTIPGDLPPGVQPLHVMARGFPVWSGEVEVALGSPRSVEVRLERPGRVRGRVVDVNGAPVAGVRVVQAEEVGGGWFFHAFPPPRTKTEEDGGFVLDWVPAGAQELNASDWQRPQLGKARVRVVVAAGQTTECELALSLGDTIEGEVVDALGNGLAGWGVRARPTRFGQIYPRSARSDASGRFVVANLGDSTFDLEVRAPGEWSIQPRAAARDVPPGARGVQLVVEDVKASTARLTARLVDEHGGVPQDVTITLWPVGDNAGNFLDYDTTSGAIEHGPCPADRYELKVERGGSTVLSSGPFELHDGETTDLGVLSLGALGSVEVRVSGIPVGELASVDLTLHRPHESSVSLVLDAGSFRAERLAPGRWTLRSRPGRHFFRDAELDVAGDETTRLTLTGELARELSIRVRVEGEADWSRVHLEVRDERGVLVHGPWPQPRGSIVERGEFPGGIAVPDGSYRVEAWTDGGQRAEAALVVDESARAAPPLELVLR